MKRILLLLILLPYIILAQPGGPATLVLTRDSFAHAPNGSYKLYHNWLFYKGDDPAMSAPGFDDSNWETVNSELRFRLNPRRSTDTFSSIGWFRLHFIADTSITGIPLALSVSQFGASEIYIDGKRKISYGKINGKDSTIGYDPQNLPFIILLPNAGKHVIAIRYANYEARLFFERNHKDLSGFQIAMSEAKSAIATDRMQSIAIPAVCALLFGFFIAFCMAHLFLYFFYRAAKSNLYFSIFCLCLGSESLILFLDKFSPNPKTEVLNSFISLILLSLGCISFSGFTNYLFSTKKTRFRIVTVICILTPFLLVFSNNIGFVVCISTVIFVFAESALITIRAIYKKVRGARIIGAGILFFTLFFLTTILFVMFNSTHDISDENVGGELFFILGIFAILCMPIFMSLYLAWNFAYVNSNLKEQLGQVELLSAQALAQEHEKKQLLEARKEDLEREVAARTTEVVAQKEEIERQHSELKTEKKKSDDLLLNILPAEVAEELKEKGSSAARLFDNVTVMFTDFVDFTTAGERLSPQELVNELHTCFKTFDDIISKYGIEKIKTIGDAYLAVCGLPEVTENHAVKMVLAAQDIIAFMEARRQQHGNRSFEVRIGIHTGSVVAGIVGVKKFAYDIWGDTVNTAARLEQNSLAGKINISQTTYDLVKDQFVCTPRGKIEAKNKGELSMYFVEGTK